jgi:putative FmdB family regulatory protein
MPIYEYECQRCGTREDAINRIDERHTGAPLCEGCSGFKGFDFQMELVISPVQGIVKFPAAGGQEYISPATGKAITSERARRDDLKRSGCRPYEGFEAESKHHAAIRAEEEKKADAKLHDDVSRAYHQLSPDKRRILETASAA